MESAVAGHPVDDTSDSGGDDSSGSSRHVSGDVIAQPLLERGRSIVTLDLVNGALAPPVRLHRMSRSSFSRGQPLTSLQ